MKPLSYNARLRREALFKDQLRAQLWVRLVNRLGNQLVDLRRVRHRSALLAGPLAVRLWGRHWSAR